MHTSNKGPNTHDSRCQNCGHELAPGDGIRFEVWGYPWDGSDAEGSITVCLNEYAICQMATDCARRVVEQGTNIQALRAAARDYENLGNLATQARAILARWSEFYQEQARWDDMAAREDGYGRIGSP